MNSCRSDKQPQSSSSSVIRINERLVKQESAASIVAIEDDESTTNTLRLSTANVATHLDIKCEQTGYRSTDDQTGDSESNANSDDIDDKNSM